VIDLYALARLAAAAPAKDDHGWRCDICEALDAAGVRPA
jgi:hypothetical protein